MKHIKIVFYSNPNLYDVIYYRDEYNNYHDRYVAGIFDMTFIFSNKNYILDNTELLDTVLNDISGEI